MYEEKPKLEQCDEWMYELNKNVHSDDPEAAFDEGIVMAFNHFIAGPDGDGRMSYSVLCGTWHQPLETRWVDFGYNVRRSTLELRCIYP